MSIYNRPIPGRAYLPFSTQMVEIKVEDIPSYTHQSIQTWRKKQYAIFVNQNGQQIMQSLQAIRYFLCKPGELNISAKLTNQQGIDIFERANNGESSAKLATEF